ncbi:MAG: hypothetical protein AB7F75_08455 [Planctomycetota bacterium]
MKRMLFTAWIVSSCLGSGGPPPVIIEKPSPPEPLWAALARMGEDAVDPVLAKGEGLEVRRSRLLEAVLNLHGRECLQDLVRSEAGLQRMKRENIIVGSEAVEQRARQILAETGSTMTEYLTSRAIDKAIWVNEITLALGFEELCRREMYQRGAALVQARTFPTEQEARADGALAGAESSWVSDFMLPDEAVRKAIFVPDTPTSVVRVADGYLALQIVKRSATTADLVNYRPSKRALELYLDQLAKERQVQYLWDRAYHELDKIHPVSSTSDATSVIKEK